MTATLTPEQIAAATQKAAALDIARVKQLHADGMGAAAIATKLHSSPPRVRALLSALGCAVPARRARRTVGGSFVSYTKGDGRLSSVYLSDTLHADARLALGAEFRRTVSRLACDPDRPTDTTISAWVHRELVRLIYVA